MENISFELGLKTYMLGGKVEVTFNPTDPAVLKRLYAAFEGLDTIQTEYEAKLKEAKDAKAWFELADGTDKAMRARIDEAFDKPVADALFEDMNCYALAGGMPVWANLLFALIEELEKAVTAEQKLANPRMEKYLKKYSKKR